ncbi:magnesium transport protein CorA [Planctomycetota bacterium]|nr:magnesium transport protein CorA [Planctomycetota bacterium]
MWKPSEKGLVKQEGDPGAMCPLAVWIDILDITTMEEKLIETSLGIDLPTRAEMQEIEASSRLYRENGTVFMTATMLIKTETGMPETTAVTFILSKERLITLRYDEPWSIKTFAIRAPRSGCQSAEQICCALFETTVERLADLLEIVAHELEQISQKVFRRKSLTDEGTDVNLQKVLFNLGRCGNLLGKVRESLVDKQRAMTFCAQAAGDWMTADSKTRLTAAMRDATSLSDHATFTSGKVSFLLDATLGLINIEQNRIIKIFSIAAVIFLPPTLVASIYGQNYDLWPGGEWFKAYGFWFTLGLMIGTVALTMWYFKRQRWM